MHELGLLTSVVDVVIKAAQGRTVESVNLEVGERSGAVVEALHAAWPLAVRGEVSSARLIIDVVPATVWCPTCACEQHIDQFFALACPVCDTPTADLRRGREFRVLSIEVT
ncbi:hydrogenase maturation nickel metallochaperone HypA [Corynebacterium pseudopelargi]|uniref:Hydrogenase nickel incorporation protein HybF n=1 Tax=Corynebacterium pseudopelargi TaxID=2080757 RepID=A0A3G6J024_9CORY|nr:hydrogenase maturation nickel metallochaperone HypA [Corynebacterium pseudopelargi]AZA10298.1 hydrogenase nickel incorporation protein HybF [Corynebacterium pseudopelargi]